MNKKTPLIFSKVFWDLHKLFYSPIHIIKREVEIKFSTSLFLSTNYYNCPFKVYTNVREF